MEKDDKLYKKVEYLLYNYNIKKASIENLNRQKEDLNIGLGAINYDQPTTSQTNKVNNLVADTAIKNIYNDNLIDLKIEKAKQEIIIVDRAIEALTEEEKEIIINYYIEGKRWYEVAAKIGFGERACRNKRKIAIHKLIFAIYGYESNFLKNAAYN